MAKSVHVNSPQCTCYKVEQLRVMLGWLKLTQVGDMTKVNRKYKWPWQYYITSNVQLGSSLLGQYYMGMFKFSNAPKIQFIWFSQKLNLQMSQIMKCEQSSISSQKLIWFHLIEHQELNAISSIGTVLNPIRLKDKWSVDWNDVNNMAIPDQTGADKMAEGGG